MKLNLVIEQLRDYCPSFAGEPGKLARVAGAAEFKMLPENQALKVPCGYVIPLEDSPELSKSQNSVRQAMTESFAVIVALDNRPDERGQSVATTLHDMRAELWHALLGWQPEGHYNGINYEGCSLLQLDRARAWYRFEFGAEMEIGPEDGWTETLPKLNEVRTKVDVIDPIVDRNLKADGVGPDGRIEFETRATNLNP